MTTMRRLSPAHRNCPKLKKSNSWKTATSCAAEVGLARAGRGLRGLASPSGKRLLKDVIVRCFHAEQPDVLSPVNAADSFFWQPPIGGDRRSTLDWCVRKIGASERLSAKRACQNVAFGQHCAMESHSWLVDRLPLNHLKERTLDSRLNHRLLGQSFLGDTSPGEIENSYAYQSYQRQRQLTLATCCWRTVLCFSKVKSTPAMQTKWL